MCTSPCDRIAASMILLSALAAASVAHALDFPSSAVVYSTAATARKPSRLIVCTYPGGVSTEVKMKQAEGARMGDDIRAPVFSPNGKTVLVTANRTSADRKTTVSPDSTPGLDLWTVDLQRSTAAPLTHDACGYENYSWSPDGNYICSISCNGVQDEHPMADTGTTAFLYLWNAHKPVKKLIGLEAVDYGWSSDSRRVYHTGSAYSVKLPHDRRASFIYADIQQGRSFLYFSSDNDLYSGTWSSNGKLLAYCESSETGYGISILRKGEKNPRRFLNTELPLHPWWSPDGRKVAFLESVPHQEGGEYLNKLRILDVVSGKTTDLWSVRGEATILGWTRDSQWVVASRFQSLAPDWLGEVVACCIGRPELTVTLCSPVERVTAFDWIQR